MKHFLQRWFIVIGMLSLLLMMSVGVGLAQRETIEITSPAEGESVSGVVTVTGTVDFPDFMKYELFLKTGEEMVWAATVYAPVTGGNLAYIDTRTYPDGMYQFVVRTVNSDSNYDEYLGPTFFIENNLGAPQPYPELESSPLYEPVAGAVARIRNCGGDNLEFDYHSAQGFCSADDLWIPFKHQNSTVCPFVDVLLIPGCKYEGTARGQGQERGVGYSFTAEAGQIYEIIYPGGAQIYIAEIEAEKQTVTESVEAGADAKTEDSVQVVELGEAEQTEEVLPVSGQGREGKTSFVIVAAGLILLLIVGGVAAVWRRRGQAV